MVNLTESRSRLQKAAKAFASNELSRSAAISRRDAADSRAVAAEKLAADYAEAAEAIAKLAEKLGAQTVKTFEGITNRCLATVFGDAIKLKLHHSESGGGTEVKVTVSTCDGEDVDPLTACGGGVVDVVSFGLRLAAIICDVSQPRKILILDEPFRFVSVNYREKLADMLESLASQCGVQIIMVTHFSEFTIGDVINVG